MVFEYPMEEVLFYISLSQACLGRPGENSCVSQSENRALFLPPFLPSHQMRYHTDINKAWTVGLGESRRGRRSYLLFFMAYFKAQFSEYGLCALLCTDCSDTFTVFLQQLQPALLLKKNFNIPMFHSFHQTNIGCRPVYNCFMG